VNRRHPITIADLAAAPPGTAVPATRLATATGDQHTVSVRGGLVHLADTPPRRAGAEVPTCPADRPGRRWTLIDAPISCTRCAAIVARRRALHRWCAMVNRSAQARRDGTPGRAGRPGTDRAGQASAHRSRAASTGTAQRVAVDPSRRCAATGRDVPRRRTGRLAARPGQPVAGRPPHTPGPRGRGPPTVPPPGSAVPATADRSGTTPATRRPAGSPAGVAPTADNHRPANPCQVADLRKRRNR